MQNVLIVAYLLIVLALIGVILLQRSEGGALGIGGGGGGGFMTARGSANILTRTTAILATLFFATAIGLTVLSGIDRGSSGILERASEGGTPTTVLDALDNLQTQMGGGAAAPATPDAPATPSVPAADPGLAVPQLPADTAPSAPVDAAPAAPADAAPAAPAAAAPAAPADTTPAAPVTPPAEPAAGGGATPPN